MAGVGVLQAVNWKAVLRTYAGWGAPSTEKMKTLHVGEGYGGIFVRWHVGEIGSSPVRRMTDIIKASGGYWDRRSGWRIATQDTLDQVKAVALGARPPWSCVPISRDGYPLVIRQVSGDGYLLEIDLDQVESVVTPLSKGDFLGTACRLTSWVHAPGNWKRLLSRTLRGGEVEAIREKMEFACAEPIYEIADAHDQAAWGAQPIRALCSPVGDIVDVRLDLGNPLHRRFIPRHLAATATVEPRAIIPGANWEEIEADFRSLGGAISVETTISRLQSQPIDLDTLPGWERPAANGFRLFEHQRAGVEFLLGRHLRAIVGDEMGLGKTGTAIASATAAGARKVLVVAPANARWVWDREIRGWSDGSQPFHLETSLPSDDLELPTTGWVIVTYDLLIARAQRHVVKEEDEARAIKSGLIVAGCPAEQIAEIWDEDSGAFRFEPASGKFLQALRLPDAFGDVQKKLNRMGRRLAAELLQRLLEWNPDAVFVDEGHRIKNAGAGRTKAVRLLLEDTTRGAVLLSGTPLRNHAGEGASLIDAILPGAKAALAKFLAKGFWTDAQRSASNRAVGELLKTAMIRRLKADVLDLPPKIRQWCDIQVADGESLRQYAAVIEEADECLAAAVRGGATERAAANSMLPILAQARRFLGLAKVENPAVADLIDEIVEEKGAVLAFAIHRDVIGVLAAQLEERGHTVGVITGETSQLERASIEKRFQEGAIDIFLGSIGAAGEALTLTRADTVVFVELDWVPAAMFQAEDRGHRAGQAAPGYHIISLPARMPHGGDCLDQYVEAVVRDKLRSINETLSESATVDGLVTSDTSKILAMITGSMMTRELREIVATRQEEAEADLAVESPRKIGIRRP